jgi:hypothetical protein
MQVHRQRRDSGITFTWGEVGPAIEPRGPRGHEMHKHAQDAFHENRLYR